MDIISYEICCSNCGLGTGTFVYNPQQNTENQICPHCGKWIWGEIKAKSLEQKCLDVAFVANRKFVYSPDKLFRLHIETEYIGSSLTKRFCFYKKTWFTYKHYTTLYYSESMENIQKNEVESRVTHFLLAYKFVEDK